MENFHLVIIRLESHEKNNFSFFIVRSASHSGASLLHRTELSGLDKTVYLIPSKRHPRTMGDKEVQPFYLVPTVRSGNA